MFVVCVPGIFQSLAKHKCPLQCEYILRSSLYSHFSGDNTDSLTCSWSRVTIIQAVKVCTENKPAFND